MLAALPLSSLSAPWGWGDLCVVELGVGQVLTASPLVFAPNSCPRLRL